MSVSRFSLAKISPTQSLLCKNKPKSSKEMLDMNTDKLSPESKNKQQESILAKNPYLLVTFNKTGYALSEVLDDVTKEFVDFSAKAHYPVLEIGAAFGVASLAALKNGAKVIVNDLDKRHLDIFSEQVPAELKDRFQLAPGSFPNDIKIPNDSLSAILCCRVIHFFDPETVISSIKKCYSMLKVGGKAFFTVESPYLKNWNKLPIDFANRKKNGDKFPGYVKTRDYINEGEIADNLPNYMHFFDEEILSNIFIECGFEVEKCFLFGRPYFAEEVQLDGRESVGIIATKRSLQTSIVSKL